MGQIQTSTHCHVIKTPPPARHPIPSHPIPSHPIPSHPIPSHPIPSHPVPNESFALDGASTTPPSKKRQQEMAEAIYQAYPRKEKKPPALKAIRKAMNEHPPEFLLERTKAYAAEIAWKKCQIIPHPATWFNDEQFNDDPENWKPPAQNAAPTSSCKPLPPLDLGGRKPAAILNLEDSPAPCPIQ